jgi:hypothetical protein
MFFLDSNSPMPANILILSIVPMCWGNRLEKYNEPFLAAIIKKKVQLI